MAVPAHDQATSNSPASSICHPSVVWPVDGHAPEAGQAFCDDGIAINSGDLDGLPTPEAKTKVTGSSIRGLGRAMVSYRLRDWCFLGNATGASRSPSFTVYPCRSSTRIGAARHPSEVERYQLPAQANRHSPD